MKTIIEPFRIKSVEPVKFTEPAERARALRAAGNNVIPTHQGHTAEHILFHTILKRGDNFVKRSLHIS